MVLEYCGSQTIQKFVDEKGRSESLLQDLFRNILEGLKFLHGHGVAHRDLKPSNILINSKGVAKIIDLGLCSISNSSETVYCGTPAYMNPQMAERRPYLAPKHDTWCIGMMLFFLKFGRHPFGGSLLLSQTKLIPTTNHGSYNRLFSFQLHSLKPSLTLWNHLSWDVWLKMKRIGHLWKNYFNIHG